MPAKKNVPTGVAMFVVVVAFGGIAYGEWSALNAKDRRDHPLIVLTKEGCTSCHSDAKMLAKMGDKEGSSNTHPLFHDASLVYSKSANSKDLPQAHRQK